MLRLKFGFRTLLLSPGSITIGRKQTCDLVLDDPQVSRQHARIIVGDQSAAIQDLGSGNGIKVNGREVKGLHRLAIGDRIQIATHIIEVVAPRDGAAAPPRDEADETIIGVKLTPPADWMDEGPTVVKKPK